MVYFQEFIPNNGFDIRVVVIGKRAFAVKRFNRRGDFRASGSGKKEYDHKLFDVELISYSFDLAKKLSMQSMAYDFIYSDEKNLCW